MVNALQLAYGKPAQRRMPNSSQSGEYFHEVLTLQTDCGQTTDFKGGKRCHLHRVEGILSLVLVMPTATPTIADHCSVAR
jgi:hypothetical protein